MILCYVPNLASTRKLLSPLREISQYRTNPTTSAKIATSDIILTQTMRFVPIVVVWDLVSTRAIPMEFRVRIETTFRIHGDRENRRFLGGNGS